MCKFPKPVLKNISIIVFFLFSLTSCFESSSSSDSTPSPTPPPTAPPPSSQEPVGFVRPCISPTPTTNNCNDGIDNDGDGLTDWQYDLGCSGPNDDEIADCRNNENGWTTYDPHPTQTEIIYVSSSGDDNNSGLAPDWDGTDGPVRSLVKAISMVRNNSADWILFKRGDTWSSESIDRGLELVAGISPENPIILASYGNSTTRPKFNYSGINWYRPLRDTHKNITIMGLELNQFNHDPADANFNPTTAFSAVFWQAEGGNFLLEDCKVNFASVVIQDVNSPNGFFEIRRNVLTNAYSVNSHSQGIFTNTSSALLITENVINHSGWNDDFRLVLNSPLTNSTTWASMNDGCFDIDLEGNLFQISGIDFGTAANMNNVAQILENAINTAVGQAGAVQLTFSLGGALKLSSTVFQSDSNYSITACTGAGIDISGSNWLNATASGVPESTIFNRNMYLSHGLGNTVVRGNIDANGASGGTQLRMGGTLDNNLFLQNPISITIGSAENNPANVSALVKNNVILDTRNIDTQDQGSGINILSYLAQGGFGPSWIDDVEIFNNIIAHREAEGLSNISGISIGGDGPYIDLNIHNNIIYDWSAPNWSDPNDHRAYALVISDINPATTNSFFQDNILQQVTSGFVAKSVALNPPIIITNNTYYSTEPEPPTVWSSGWFDIGGSVSSADWITQTNDTNPTFAIHTFPVDPTRTIADYCLEIGGCNSFETFIPLTLQQSRFNWNDDYTAYEVNKWIREGFSLTIQ